MKSPESDRTASVVAHNVRRIMAKEGLTHGDLVAAADLDDRTIRAVLRGVKRPRSLTLQKLASGLGVTVDALFEPPLGLSPAAFDTATNPAVAEAKSAQPDVFDGWGPAEFDELASQFGLGGQLTVDGVIQAAASLNSRRQLLRKARTILESAEGELLAELIEVLHERALLRE